MDRKPLTPTQRRILLLLAEHGSAVFFGETRVFKSWQTDAGLVIQAYMEPERFLVRRGLLERVQSNRRGYVFKLTDHGAKRAALLVY